MPYNQGDIVLVSFPLTDLSSSKVRPAIVVSGIDVNNTDDVILAAITTNLRNDGFSFPIDNSHLTKPMQKQSEVRCHKLFTCDQTSIHKTITKLSKSQIDKLTKIIKGCFSTV